MMVNNSELRLGNIVKCEGEYNIVNMLIAKGIGINDELHKEEDIYPVDLSEDILLNCGFDKIENYNPMFIHCTSPLRIKANKYTQSKKIDCRISILKSNFFYQISRTVNLKLDYLHQLQNLYWCLCEKELICNLK